MELKDVIIVAVEELDVNKMTTKEKAIFEAGHQRGYERCKNLYSINAIIAKGMFAMIIGLIIGVLIGFFTVLNN